MSFVVEYAARAERDLADLPKPAREAIGRAARRLATDPWAPGTSQLTGPARPPRRRVRVGDYRLIYIVDDDRRAIVVLMVGHRKDFYRRR